MITWSPTKSKLKEQLRDQEAQYQRLIENIPEVVWRGTAEGDAIFISEKIISVFGYTPEEVLRAGARLWFGRMHPEDRESVTRSYAELFEERRPFDVQYRIQHRDGHWMWWHDRAVLVEDSPLSRRYAEGVLSDITEKKRLEEQFQHSQKMEEVGQLAGGIAHDFNNLVQVIGGYVELLERQVRGDITAEDYAAKIKSAAQGAASLTKQFLT
jgi:PAS domain S-box-containing protein